MTFEIEIAGKGFLVAFLRIYKKKHRTRSAKDSFSLRGETSCCY